MSAITGSRGRAVAIDSALGFVVSGLLLAGLVRPGFPLLRDWVATPNPPLSDAARGLGESAARAVPQDVAMVWASRALEAVGLPLWPLTGLLTLVFCVWLAVAAGALVRRALPEAGATFWLRAPAVVVAVWNPFVVERLLQGHWSLLAGVAAAMTMPVLLARSHEPRSPAGARMPAEESATAEACTPVEASVTAEACETRELCAQNGPFRAHKSSESEHSGRISRRVGVAGACAALAVAGLTPTGWLLAVLAAAVALSCANVAGAQRFRAALALGATAVVTALPWLLATALAGAGTAAGTGVGAGTGAGGGVTGAAGAAVTGVAEFAARAEPGIGTLGSVVALGGIWNSQAVPPSRATLWAVAALVLLLIVWGLAARGLWRTRRSPAVLATVPTAIVIWLLVAAAATVPGIAALDALVTAVPGAGLLRDTQKFVALALPATVLAFAFATQALAASLRLRGARGAAFAAVAVTAIAVAAVPDAPRALWDQLRPVTYGEGWAEVAGIVNGQPGDLLVLPAGSFRSTPLWADGRAVLDPAPRLLDTRVLVAGDLVVGSAATVTGEGDRARRATEALLRGEDPQVLAEMGVRWVLDERTSAGPRGESARTLGGETVQEEPTTTTTTTTTPAHGSTVKFADSELVLYELPPPDRSDRTNHAGRTDQTDRTDHADRTEHAGPTDHADHTDQWDSVIAALPASAQPASATARAWVLAAHAAWLLTLAATLAVALAPERGTSRARFR